MGRFINADGLVSTGQGVLGYNMYAYCGNNPIVAVDKSGGVPIRNTMLMMSDGLTAELDPAVWEQLAQSREELSFWERAKQVWFVIKTFKDSLTFEIGVGMGLRGSVKTTIEGMSVDLSGGYKVDGFNFNIGHGGFDYGTKEVYGGGLSCKGAGLSFETSAFHTDRPHNCPLNYRPSEMSQFMQCPMSQISEFGPNPGFSIGVEGYFIVGGTVELGWDCDWFLSQMRSAG